MSENGKENLITVSMSDGRMEVHMGKYNLALLSHAVRMASMTLDNIILGQQSENEKKEALKKSVVLPPDVLNRMR